MSEAPSPTDIDFWQRKLAAQANNRAWALADQPTRSGPEQEEMLQAAHAAAYGWKRVGTASNIAHANQLLAHVYALLGLAEPAQHHLRQSEPFFLEGPSAPWELAFAHLVAAHVAGAAGHREAHALRYQAAVAAIEALQDPEDRSILQTSLRVVPKPAG